MSFGEEARIETLINEAYQEANTMNKEGRVEKKFDNGSSTALYIEGDGNKYTVWHNNGGAPDCNIGDVVSFAYKEVNKGGKTYYNVNGAVAKVAAGAAASAPTPLPSGGSIGRNGAQVGASINQAIQYMEASGTDITLEGVEHFAKDFILMGDRLAKVEAE